MLRPALALSFLGLLAVPAVAGGGCGGDCYRKTWMPPVYETQAEKYLVRAPRTYAHVIPAEYAMVHEKVMVHPGGRHWTLKRDHHGHEVGCWVHTPARYETVARKVMVRGPEVVPVAEPAQYGVRMHTVMTQPAYKTWVPVGRGYGHAH